MQKDVLYERAYKCLFCGAEFPVWKLYPSALSKLQKFHELFDFPFYVPDPNLSFVNYLFLEIKVCKGCCFSSNEDGYFLTGSETGRFISLDKIEIERINAAKGERLSIASSAKTLFVKSRSFDDTVLSLKLAINCSKTFFESDQRRHGLEIVKMGNYGLRIYRLYDEKQDKIESQKWLRFSRDIMLKVLEVDLSGALYYKALYQIAAISIYLGDNKPAYTAYETFRRLNKDQSKEHTVYLNRIKKVWEDRDDIRSAATSAE